MELNRSVLVLIGQIAAGKTTTARVVAERVGARLISVEEMRDLKKSERLHAVVDAIAEVDADRVIVECSGTTSDFEAFLVELRRYYALTVIKLVCSPETAHQRLRSTRLGTEPRGGPWPVHLRWTERRLRSVPADATIETDILAPTTVADVVSTCWTETTRTCRVGEPAVRGESFSFSKLAAYERCPLSYRFRYVERRDSAYRFKEELVGHLVHAGLCWLYRTRETSGFTSQADLLAFVNAEAADLGFRIRNPGITWEVRDEAAAMLVRHYAGAFKIDRRQTRAVEKRFELDLGDATAFVGIIDRLTESQAGIPVVIDYKTSPQPPRSSANVPDLLQLEAYGLATLLDSRARVVEIRRHYVRTGEEDVEVLRRPDIQRVRYALLRWIRRVTGAVEFSPRPTKLCGWCGYNQVCSSRSGPMRDAVAVRSPDDMARLVNSE